MLIDDLNDRVVYKNNIDKKANGIRSYNLRKGDPERGEAKSESTKRSADLTVVFAR